MQQIAELTYLERVIKENLRLYPSVPVIGRLLTENTELGITENFVPYKYIGHDARSYFNISNTRKLH